MIIHSPKNWSKTGKKFKSLMTNENEKQNISVLIGCMETFYVRF